VNSLNRRAMLKLAAAGTAAGVMGSRDAQTFGLPLGLQAKDQRVGCSLEGTVRDRFWMWGHEAGSHNTVKDKSQWPYCCDYGIPKNSRMTPAEGAFYMGIPNVLLIRYGKRPEAPFHQFALSLSPFKRVVWSITGDGGRTEGEEEVVKARELLGQFPNFCGVIMDDFFREAKADQVAVFTPDQLRKIKELLGHSPLWVTLYTELLDHSDRISEHIQLMDKITLWTWKGSDLVHLENNFQKLDKLAPAASKVMGCYLWNYGEKKPIPVSLMERQCELGLKWLKSGKIDEMIFLSNNVVDLGLENVEWTRNWIRQVGDQKL